MSKLKSQLAVEEREEIGQAVRVLLRFPLLTDQADPAAFDLVRRRRGPLTQWFDRVLGWPLVVEPRQGYARLSKVRSDAPGDRPARRLRSGKAPLDRRRYVLFCVTCAELLSVPVTTVGILADRVVHAMLADPALGGFDTAARAERMAFVDVLRLLESYGALCVLDGSTDSFAESASAKVLYRVQSGVLLRLLAAPVSPSRVAAELGDRPAVFDELVGAVAVERRYGGTGLEEASETQRGLWLRHSVMRRLFDDPVVYRDELTEAQLGYVTSITGRKIMREAAELAGFELEERAEGWLLVDPAGVATDERFPDDSSHAKVAALLLLETVMAAGGVGAEPEGLIAAAEGLLERFPDWAKAYQSEEGAARLVEDAMRVLVSFGLARYDGGRAVARPAAARYRVTSAEAAGVGKARS
ncbi:TIGR02678 family protein [Peterkaempfera sp. SMS 1(5)a]|uniref:TIGR02678 family protein n=1 Tax=Peterkaempfera podocarpi TaxID=3232308 RepID=UPI00366AB75B